MYMLIHEDFERARNAVLASATGSARSLRRTYMKVCGLAAAAEMFSNESARWYFTRMGEDHDLLEALEDRYVKEHDV